MTGVLLLVIYLAFISLGLPDSLLGAAWPSMYPAMGAAVSWAGGVSAVITGGTVVSSLLCDRLVRRWGTGAVTLGSVALTAAALFGFSVSRSFPQLLLWAIPYGLGAGSVDAALNNFVALHYRSRHMSWLHCFWGVGATAGPCIMGLCLVRKLGWGAGYRTVGLIQLGLTAMLAASLPLWRRFASDGGERPRRVLSPRQALALPGAKAVLVAFFFYNTVEATAGLWAGSYLVLARGLDAGKAARWAALFYLGITAGRLACGFFADRMGDRRMIRLGLCAIGAGIVILLLPLGETGALWGLLAVGAGCAPVFPSLLHATPAMFGPENSQSLMGMQMAGAYLGSALMPPLFGALAGRTGLWLYPVFLLAALAVTAVLTGRAARVWPDL